MLPSRINIAAVTYVLMQQFLGIVPEKMHSNASEFLKPLVTIPAPNFFELFKTTEQIILLKIYFI